MGSGGHLRIGALLFDGLDQMDLTGPFEVLSRIPDSEYRIYAKSMNAVRDANGLRLFPDVTLAKRPRWTCCTCRAALARRS